MARSEETTHGVRLAVRVMGDRSTRPPVVLLHGGGPGCSAVNDFASVAGLFARLGPVMLADLAQYGESPAPDIDGPAPEFQAELVAAEIECRYDVPVDLVCQSLGGSVALQLAARRSELVRRVVVTGSQPLLTGPDSDLELGPRARADYYGGSGPSRDKMRALIAELEWHDASDLPDELVDARYATSISPAALRIGSGDIRRGSPLDLAPELAHVSAPVLLLWGEHDPFSTPGYARRVAAALPDATVRSVPNTAHHPQSERPLDWLGAVQEFLLAPTAAGSSAERCSQ